MPIARGLNRFMKFPIRGAPMTNFKVCYRTNSNLPNTSHPTPETPVDSLESNTPRTSGGMNTPTTLPKERQGILTGYTKMPNKKIRIMERVFQKRKKRLMKATNAVMEVFKTQDIQFKSAEIFVRKAGSFDDSEDNAQREVHIALRGIAHTVVVLRSANSTNTFLLDRVVEGIRLVELKVDKDDNNKIEKCSKFKPEEMLKLSTYNNIGLSSQNIADWIDMEAKTEYNMLTNSCVHFSFYFHQRFLSGLKTRQFFEALKTKINRN